MYYVEFLRVFRALRVFAICSAALLLIAFILRMSSGTHWSNFAIESQHFSASAKKTVKIGAGGAETTTIVDPAKGLRLVQVRTPGKVEVMLYEAPNRVHRGHPDHNHWAQGSGVHLDQYTQADGTFVTHYTNDRHLPADVFLVLAGFVTAIFASVIGGSLSKENDGHLELAWTKPVSRQTFAFMMFGIDAAGMLIAGLLAFGAALTATVMFLGIPVLVSSSNTTGTLVLAVLFPLSWYALGQALTASLRRAGPVLGMSWVIGLACVATVHAPYPMIQLIVRTFNTINPLAYYSSHGASLTLLGATQLNDILALFAITAIAITASLVQWRRLEA
ncbi:MAG: hypothetical protein ABR584_03315 [Candidatus Baltobacteraceae bacterium]